MGESLNGAVINQGIVINLFPFQLCNKTSHRDIYMHTHTYIILKRDTVFNKIIFSDIVDGTITLVGNMDSKLLFFFNSNKFQICRLYIVFISTIPLLKISVYGKAKLIFHRI